MRPWRSVSLARSCNIEPDRIYNHALNARKLIRGVRFFLLSLFSAITLLFTPSKGSEKKTMANRAFRMETRSLYNYKFGRHNKAAIRVSLGCWPNALIATLKRRELGSNSRS